LFLVKVALKTLINLFPYINKVLWQHVVLCKVTWLRMRLTVGVRSVLRCERLAETCWSDFKCFTVKFYVSALVGVIIKVILKSARCDNKDSHIIFFTFTFVTQRTR